MLSALSIRDVVLIDRLDLNFGQGLTVLTGETGAGKSILLDSLGLALGARADSGLVRAGQDQASVTAFFTPEPTHPAFGLLMEQGLEAEEDIVIRRIVNRDGKSRAFVNDQPVSAGLLRRLAALLVEVQGQHDQIGLADPAAHGPLLDTFGVDPAVSDAVVSVWRRWRDRLTALDRARKAMAEAQRDEEWLRHAVNELSDLSAETGEEEALAQARHAMQMAARRAEAIAAALSEIAPRERRNPGPGAALRAAARSLQRLLPSSLSAEAEPENPLAPALAAIDRAEEAIAEAETLLSRLSQESDADPRELERVEERLFALRAAARKHSVTVAELPALRDRLAERLAALDTGSAHLTALETAAAADRLAFIAAAKTLSAARLKAAKELQAAIMAELPPLRLDRTRFVAEISELAESGWSARGVEQVQFLIATNPGQTPGAIDKIASGGELSRLMLALKLVLSRGSPVGTLIFDEVDSGIGGATAAAVGERLARLSQDIQLLTVTHSPQVAARGSAHLRVAKAVDGGRSATRVEPLTGAARREEVARMLAGEEVTEAARAAADSLLGNAA
ncbi:DNA repair protein RecN [Acidisoma cellulosilytica]|uniref:DNA repair protein RecN n=1 Tax=Acidisoma cellulosilyticum TaxID=2802395 RepID=A0A963Z0U7_9PROT|nr:DNA repair protein RecN [Acidisoma cellulosilyticum]MCB8880792.1 DNA repair protein RecN [Acidisoma cellulosilyticum]